MAAATAKRTAFPVVSQFEISLALWDICTNAVQRSLYNLLDSVNLAHQMWICHREYRCYSVNYYAC